MRRGRRRKLTVYELKWQFRFRAGHDVQPASRLGVGWMAHINGQTKPLGPEQQQRSTRGEIMSAEQNSKNARQSAELYTKRRTFTSQMLVVRLVASVDEIIGHFRKRRRAADGAPHGRDYGPSFSF